MEWQDIETAPRNGIRFLAALSNGWVVVLAEPHHARRYEWYFTATAMSVPIARTHSEDSLSDSVLATHWMPLPEAAIMKDLIAKLKARDES